MKATQIVSSLLKCACIATLAFASLSHAAAPPQAPPPAPVAPRAFNAIDLTGMWVAVVTEDWRWRMVTPPKGDYASMPLNPEGRRVADTWDPALDGSCQAYGAAALMRMPTRVRISWESDSVLKVETDAGQQMRRLIFGSGPDSISAPATLQGVSQAKWVPDLPRSAPVLGGAAGGGDRGGIGTARHSTLEVRTTKMAGGWLRRNGVPYSKDAVMTEYFDRFASQNGDEWMAVTTIIDDPVYLREPYVTSSHFKKENDGSKWHPTACKS